MGWWDHPLCRHVSDPDVLPSVVTYPWLHLYSVFLFKVYVQSDSEKKPFSTSTSAFEHVSKSEEWGKDNDVLDYTYIKTLLAWKDS